MDDVTKNMIAQLGGVLIQGVFTYLTQRGMDAEDIEDLFIKERRKFQERHPSTLPDPD